MDIRVYFQSLCESSLTILETLFTKFYIIDSTFSKEWLQLKSRIDELAYLEPKQFYSNIQINAEDNLIRHHLKIGHPKLIEKCGYAAKNLYQLFRYRDVVERYKQGESFNTIFQVKNPQDLLDIKRGRWPEALADSCIKDMELYWICENKIARMINQMEIMRSKYDL
jgi:hypothetical protein